MLRVVLHACEDATGSRSTQTSTHNDCRQGMTASVSGFSASACAVMVDHIYSSRDRDISLGITTYTKAAQHRETSNLKHNKLFGTNISDYGSNMCVSYYIEYACNHTQQTGQTHRCIHEITGRSYKCSPRYQKEPQSREIEALDCPACRRVLMIRDVPVGGVSSSETMCNISSAVSEIKHLEMDCVTGDGLQALR